MQHQPPQWLRDAVETGPRGFQADIARSAKITPDKLSKVLSGERALKHDEAERLKQAIETHGTAPEGQVSHRLDDAPEHASEVAEIVGRKPSKGRPATLVMLLKSGGYAAFRLDPPRLAELREALLDMEAR